MQAKIQAVRNKVQECINDAERMFGITMPKINVRFDLTGRAAGMAGCKLSLMTGAYDMYLRFNTEHMRLGGQSWEHIINDTVPHEVAHSVCQAFPKFGRNHDAGWKRVCVALGGNGSRCYKQSDAPEAVAKAKPYAYTTSTGHIVAVSPVIHRKIQTRGAAYTYRGKGRISKDSKVTMTNASMLAAPTTKHVAPTVAPVVTKQVPPIVAAARNSFTIGVDVPQAPKAGGSNADKVRALIALAKSNGHSEVSVVAAAMATLGMKPALARTYVKNNWSKV